jgi:hypothetical protein
VFFFFISQYVRDQIEWKTSRPILAIPINVLYGLVAYKSKLMKALQPDPYKKRWAQERERERKKEREREREIERDRDRER